LSRAASRNSASSPRLKELFRWRQFHKNLFFRRRHFQNFLASIQLVVQDKYRLHKNIRRVFGTDRDFRRRRAFLGADEF
jgi:hypothetical protein